MVRWSQGVLTRSASFEVAHLCSGSRKTSFLRDYRGADGVGLRSLAYLLRTSNSSVKQEVLRLPLQRERNFKKRERGDVTFGWRNDSRKGPGCSELARDSDEGGV